MAIEAIGAIVASVGVEAAKQAAAEAARQLADKVLASNAEAALPQQGLQPNEEMASIQQNDAFRIGDLHLSEADGKSALKAKESQAAESLRAKVDDGRLGESSPYDGGSYGDLAKDRVEGTEIHHMPPASVNELDYNDGPAIRMDKEDHRETASYGSSNEARAFRAEQEALIKEGKWEDAVNRDIADIRGKFGGKYDDAIAQMKDYSDAIREKAPRT